MSRNQAERFLVWSVSRAERFQWKDFRHRTVCSHPRPKNSFHRRNRPLWLNAWAWKTHPPINQRTRGRALTLRPWWTHGQWFCFLFCVKQYVPSVHWRCMSFFLRSIVCCENESKKTPLLTTSQMQLWPKMAQELNPHWGWKERRRHNNKTERNTSDPTSTLAL